MARPRAFRSLESARLATAGARTWCSAGARLLSDPAPTDLVAILLETLSQRLGGSGHAAAWRSIGINPNRGRDLLARSSRNVDWPIWKTLRDAALGL